MVLEEKKKEKKKGQVFRIKKGSLKDELYVIEGLWKDLTGKSWMDSDGNPACLQYAVRSSSAKDELPLDNNVYYGHIGSFGHLVHESELGEEIIKEDD